MPFKDFQVRFPMHHTCSHNCLWVHVWCVFLFVKNFILWKCSLIYFNMNYVLEFGVYLDIHHKCHKLIIPSSFFRFHSIRISFSEQSLYYSSPFSLLSRPSNIETCRLLYLCMYSSLKWYKYHLFRKTIVNSSKPYNY